MKKQTPVLLTAGLFFNIHTQLLRDLDLDSEADSISVDRRV